MVNPTAGVARHEIGIISTTGRIWPKNGGDPETVEAAMQDQIPARSAEILSERAGLPGVPAASPDVPPARDGVPPIDTRLGCRLAREIASTFLDVPVCDIDRPTRAIAPICEARHVAMYLAHVVFQIPLTGMAGPFGRDRTTIAYAVRRIEDRRDDAEFDAVIERLERLGTAIRAAFQPGSGRGEAA
ncbi:helix-turn-helix domain-containing protein [Aurantimonas sp. NFXS3]|uniref:helix-turn-helix domain-containing protein n=1 Tax=Aurantimonas sp. NFXS3 TaxID=2818434 RepID=UPI003B9E53D2